MIERLEFLVEEPSAEAALRALVPKIAGTASFEVYAHSGKRSLKSKLHSRLRGYQLRRKNDSWFREHCRVIVILDCDSEDCKALKRELQQTASQAGLAHRTGTSKDFVVAFRIAIEELEAWFFGDWEAVRAAYPRVPATIPQKAAFRSPDAIAGGTWEALQRIVVNAGEVWVGKIDNARRVAAAMDPSRNTSPSFCSLRNLIQELTQS